MNAQHRLWLIPILLLLAGIGYFVRNSGGTRPPPPVAQQLKGDLPLEGKKLTHEETLQWVAEHRAWRVARKTKPIWARAIEAEEIGKEFQTADHAIETGRAGFWLCVGVAGEPWFQKLEKIEGKYELTGKEVKSFRFDARPSTYRIFKPKITTRNWAARVEGPGIAGFFVRPNYDPDHPLYSPAGGFVVRDDVKDPYQAKPDDVWLVQEELFESTYEIVR